MVVSCSSVEVDLLDVWMYVCVSVVVGVLFVLCVCFDVSSV